MVVQYTGPGRRSPTICGQGVGTCRGVGKVAVHGTCTLYASPHHTPLSTRTAHAQGGVTVPYSGKLSSKKFAEKTFMYRPKTSKFVKVFSLKSFPVYGSCFVYVFVTIV